MKENSAKNGTFLQRIPPEKMTFKKLLSLSPWELSAIFLAGSRPSLEELNGWEYRGVNISKAAHYLRIEKFKKGFYRDETTPPGELYGYNVLVYSDGIDKPHRAFPSEVNPIRHGYFLVRPVREDDPGELKIYRHALLLDYSRGPRNPIWYPGNLLRDLIVQVNPENPRLLLGRAYISLGNKPFFSNFFVLERSNANLSHF